MYAGPDRAPRRADTLTCQAPAPLPCLPVRACVQAEIVSRTALRHWLPEDDEILDPDSVNLAEHILQVPSHSWLLQYGLPPYTLRGARGLLPVPLITFCLTCRLSLAMYRALMCAVHLCSGGTHGVCALGTQACCMLARHAAPSASSLPCLLVLGPDQQWPVCCMCVCVCMRVRFLAWLCV